MSTVSVDVPVLKHIFHPSDFSAASDTAFAHALKAALVAQAGLTILHVAKDEKRDWTNFPGVRETLIRWDLLPRNSVTADVSRLGIGVEKVQAFHDDPVESVTAYLEKHHADLIVLATDQNKERTLWLSRSIAAPIARKSRQMTLFIPKGTYGFVSMKDGSITLKNVLIPIAAAPSAQPAIHAVMRLIHRLNCPSGTVTLLHVGDKNSLPHLQLPDIKGWNWNTVVRNGDIIDVILDMASEIKADLIAMTTEGRNGFLDALRGSHSERVLRRTPCPLLAIPADGLMASMM
ncbi:universal stress protein [Nitrospira sp. KM1]|uniref:universal stress protein n=1 Tax=Nitrospira sp. KM1 TaxID=1936990 RepID=UPI0013A79F94|nr:universal stress protein [Nitrospira sp. KM1]BCA53086.1 universal stress protein [Nitrospira sp. KM1]